MRVQWKRDGKLVNERVKTSACIVLQYIFLLILYLIFAIWHIYVPPEKQLLEAISFYIQTVKPELIPKPPFTNTSNTAPPTTEVPSSAGTTSKQPTAPSSKSKQQAVKTKGKAKAEKVAEQERAKKSRLPQPPEPLPPLASRLSAYSPALPSGVLVDTIKAGMSASAADNALGGPQGGAKGKRKVVRVRG